MGANKVSNLQKCGEILMDINSKNRKTKTYIFHCTFCNLECDQLKKFSLHIGEEHLSNFDDILSETELKFEAEPEEIRIQTFTEVPDIKAFESAILDKNNVNPDPLDTVNPLTTVINHDTINCDVKNELNENCIVENNICQGEEKDCTGSTGDNKKETKQKLVTEKPSKNTSFAFNSDSEDYIKDNLDEMPLKKRKQTKKLKQKCIAIEMSSDESKDADSNILVNQNRNLFG